MKSAAPAKKLDPHRVPIPERPVPERITSFGEVIQGYALRHAMIEADRCLQCPAQPCVTACPAHNDIPGFLRHLSVGDVAGAAEVLGETTYLPAICGRVCDVGRQCEGACVVAKRGEAIAIGTLERFVGDWEIEARESLVVRGNQANGLAVAVIGSGPGGLTVAHDLAVAGCQVELFEADHEPGGILHWGIPQFRLPEAPLQRVLADLQALDVPIHLNRRLGRDISVDSLLADRFQAVVLACGAPLDRLLAIPGSNLKGVVKATNYLRLVRGRAVPRGAAHRALFASKLLVIGGGSTAMDVAQTALRLGTRQVTVIYRRGPKDLPAVAGEVQAAQAEGVHFEYWTTPIAVLDNGEGAVGGLRCARTQPPSEGEDRHATPLPIPGSEVILEADAVAIAIGYGPDPTLTEAAAGVECAENGRVRADATTGRTSHPRVWAIGDLTTGPATVVGAMAAGRRAAQDILATLPGALRSDPTGEQQPAPRNDHHRE